MGVGRSEAMLAGLPVLCSKYAGCAEELFPPECIFDPEDATEFVKKLRIAINGQLPPPDLTRLKTSAQVATDLIAALQHSAMGGHKPRIEKGNFSPWSDFESNKEK